MSGVRKSMVALALSFAMTPLLLLLTAQPGPSWTCTFGCDAEREGMISQPGTTR